MATNTKVDSKVAEAIINVVKQYEDDIDSRQIVSADDITLDSQLLPTWRKFMTPRNGAPMVMAINHVVDPNPLTPKDLKDNQDRPFVYCYPYKKVAGKTGESKPYLRFAHYEDEHEKQCGKSDATLALHNTIDPLLGAEIFNSKAAVKEWPKDGVRHRKHIIWLLIAWLFCTNGKLDDKTLDAKPKTGKKFTPDPDEKGVVTTSRKGGKAKKKASEKKRPLDDEVDNAAPPVKQRKLNVNSKNADADAKLDAHRLWRDYTQGNISTAELSSEESRRVRKAAKLIEQPCPKRSKLRDAHKEFKQREAEAKMDKSIKPYLTVELTPTWKEWQQALNSNVPVHYVAQSIKNAVDEPMTYEAAMELMAIPSELSDPVRKSIGRLVRARFGIREVKTAEEIEERVNADIAEIWK